MSWYWSLLPSCSRRSNRSCAAILCEMTTHRLLPLPWLTLFRWDSRAILRRNRDVEAGSGEDYSFSVQENWQEGQKERRDRQRGNNDKYLNGTFSFFSCLSATKNTPGFSFLPHQGLSCPSSLPRDEVNTKTVYLNKKTSYLNKCNEMHMI